ncbi:conserved hypothetical protein [Ricinus communis]|uniref:Uncharacterized protein n=1 Tax=Ricinus communis TaxID=3988 RepID=B9TC69_RICCO|nr:conserved hypothetical protein [Ricinus communis]
MTMNPPDTEGSRTWKTVQWPLDRCKRIPALVITHIFAAKPGNLAHVVSHVQARWPASDRRMIGRGSIWRSRGANSRTPGCAAASPPCWKRFGRAWGRRSRSRVKTGLRPRLPTGFCQTTA